MNNLPIESLQIGEDRDVPITVSMRRLGAHAYLFESLGYLIVFINSAIGESPTVYELSNANNRNEHLDSVLEVLIETRRE